MPARLPLTIDKFAAPPVPGTLEELVPQAIQAGRTRAGEILTWLRPRANGLAAGLSLSGIDEVLHGLARAGKIKLQSPGKGETLDQPDRWAVVIPGA